MEKLDAVTALAALAQDNRLDVFRLLVQAGPGGLAAGQIAAALDLAPNNAAAHAALAGLLNRRGFTREAVAHYEFVLRTRPAGPAVLLGLARAHADAAQLDEAQKRLDELEGLAARSAARPLPSTATAPGAR